MIQKDRVLFFADGSVNVDPSAEELAEIAGLGADTARWFGFDPTRRAALLLELRQRAQRAHRDARARRRASRASAGRT